jgi:hypothetical protein
LTFLIFLWIFMMPGLLVLVDGVLIPLAPPKLQPPPMVQSPSMQQPLPSRRLLLAPVISSTMH